MWLLHLKPLLRNLILPPMGPLLLALLGLLSSRRRPRLSRALLWSGFGSLWLLSTPVVAERLVHWAERYPALDPAKAANAQAIVILGGGGQRTFAAEFKGPAANPVLLQRLSYGAYVARLTRLPILVTGYQIEAVAMKVTLQRDYGLDARWVDDDSIDTFQNAQHSTHLLQQDGVHRIVLITSATHLWRAAHEFTAAGLEVVPAPVGLMSEHESDVAHYLPNVNALLQSYSAGYELLGEWVREALDGFHLRRQADG